MKHRISVLVICYKQEGLIRRAIDSLLKQKDYIYEICVSDDCSPDKTWEILKEYDRLNPGLFKLHRNEPNVGIFENIEYTWTMPTGDLIYQLSGDDKVPDGWFKTVSEYISTNKIDYINKKICIYGDVRFEFPNGDIQIMQNNAVCGNIDSFRLATRCIISSRGCVYSKLILNHFFKCSKGRSYVVELAQDRQLQLFTDEVYYIPHEGNVYYASLGVSTTLNDTQQRRIEREEVREYALSILKEHGGMFCSSDIYYFKYKTAVAKLYRTKSLKSYFKIIFYLFRSFDLHLRKSYLVFFKRACFAFLRRLPHEKPLIVRI